MRLQEKDHSSRIELLRVIVREGGLAAMALILLGYWMYLQHEVTTRTADRVVAAQERAAAALESLVEQDRRRDLEMQRKLIESFKPP